MAELDEQVVAPAADDDSQAEADFAAGAAMGTTAQPRDESGRFAAPKVEPDPKAGADKGDVDTADAGKAAADKGTNKSTPTAVTPPSKPEYVQITKEQIAKFEAALGKTEEFEKQFSKVFGTVGDMQKIMRGLQAQTPKGAAVKLPSGAFDAMKKDFPELAEHMQTAMASILQGVEGTGGAGAKVDDAEFERKLEERVLKLAADDLADEFPDWHKIVGAVNTDRGEKPDPNNSFRKWLATKPQDYQDRVNSTNSAGVITRAIRTFKSETKTAPPAPKDDKQAVQRTNRIAAAIRPKGDGGHPPGKSADEDFEAGFKTG